MRADGSAVVAEQGDAADGGRSTSVAPRSMPAAWALPAAAVSIYALDQLSKHWALQELQDRTIDLVGSLRLNLAFNTGAAFSGGTGLGPFIAVAVVAIIVVLVVQRHRVVHTALGTVAVGMIVGGALGNLSDRLLRAGDGLLGGAVVDFIDLQWWPVFNVADAAVVLGGIALVIESGRAGAPTPS